MRAENGLFPFSSTGEHSKIERGETPADLDNLHTDEALTSVQASREFTTTEGCHVKVFFRKEYDPGIRKEVARLLLAAFEERIVDDETSHVSVQSFDQRTGR